MLGDIDAREIDHRLVADLNGAASSGGDGQLEKQPVAVFLKRIGLAVDEDGQGRGEVLGFFDRDDGVVGKIVFDLNGGGVGADVEVAVVAQTLEVEVVNDLAEAAPFGVGLDAVDEVGGGIEGVDAGGEEALVRVKEHGVAEEGVDGELRAGDVGLGGVA